MNTRTRYSWLALGLCGLAVASLLDAAPDEQTLRLRLGIHKLSALRISCAGNGYHSGGEWQFGTQHRPTAVSHNFQAAEGSYVCELSLSNEKTTRQVSRQLELNGAAVTLPLEHEVRAMAE